MSEPNQPSSAVLLTQPVKGLFFQYFKSNLISSLMLAVYVLFDTIFIGRGVGSQGLAALNITLPCYSLEIGFAQMMGMGGATALSICRGQGDHEEANRYFTAAVVFTCTVSLILGILGGVFWRPIAYLGGADDSIIELVGDYLRILNGGAILFVVNNFLGVFVRNDRDPQRVMVAGIVSCILNIILDYVCIFLFDWGMAGAAGATAFSGFISILIMLTHFLKPDCQLKFRFDQLHLFSRLKRIMQNGISSLIAECSSGLIILLFNIFLMRKGGVAAVTCYSIISNVAYLFLAVYNGASATLQPLCSINAGAGNYSRVRQFFRLGVWTVLLSSLAFVLIGEFFPQTLVAIFTEPTPDVIAVANYAIRIYFIAYLPMGLNIISATFHQSLEASREATLISLGRGLLFLVPVLLCLSSFFGLGGIWATVPLSELLTLCLSIWLLRRLFAARFGEDK